MVTQEDINETCALFRKMADAYGILETIQECFGGAESSNGIAVALPLPKEFAESDITEPDWEQRILNSLHQWEEMTGDNTVKNAIPLVSSDFSIKVHQRGFGKRQAKTVKSWLIEEAWKQMNDRQKDMFIESIITLNCYDESAVRRR